MQFFTDSSPYIKHGDSTNKIMIRVIIALIPAMIYSIILFGYKALLLYCVAIISCTLVSIIVKKLRKKTITVDYAAIITGILLVMTLPPSATVTMIIIGSIVAIVFAREVFGGLGSNVFNPALVGRAFLQVAFPANMTMYTPPKNVPFLSVFQDILKDFNVYITGATQSLDAINALTQATPLTFFKFNSIDFGGEGIIAKIAFESHYYLQLFLGSTAGAIGETSFVLILIGGIFLLITKTIDWRIPLGMVIALSVVSGILSIAIPGKVASPIYQILSGGFALGAFFMATDLVTCPSSPLGIWIYSLLIGAVLATLRVFGSSPEYMMYSILIGNMFMPLISMYTRPLPFGKKELLKMNRENIEKGGNA